MDAPYVMMAPRFVYVRAKESHGAHLRNLKAP